MTDPIKIRSSSWGDLLDCSQRWYATNVLGMRLPASVPAHMGTSIHHGTAIFDQGKVEHREVTVDEAVAGAVDMFWKPGEDVQWTNEDYSKRDALDITIRATEAYCNILSPQYEFQSVELRPAPLTIAVEGTPIEISGQMDRTRIKKGTEGLGINDVKTGKTVVSASGQVKTNGFKFQMGIYELLTEHSLGMEITLPAEISAVSTGKTVRTGTGEIHNAKDLMVGTEEDPGIIETVAAMVKHGLFPPNPRSMLCGERYCVFWHRCKAHD